MSSDPSLRSLRVSEVRTYRLPQALFVQVMAENGASGWGECSPNSHRVVETFIRTGLAPRVTGRSVWDAEPIWDDLFFENHDLGPSGALPSAIAGIDIALWDLRGRLTGQPVATLLGGRYRDRVTACGSVGVDGGRRLTPAQAAARAAAFVDRGFRAVTLRMEIRERHIDPVPDPTVAYARAVRQAIGDRVELIVDIDSGYTAARAIQVGKRLRDELGVRYLEEPVGTEHLRELAQVSDALDIPVIAGEKAYTRWQIRDLVDIGRADMLNPDVTRCGGLTEAKKIAAFAQACSKPIVPRNTKPTFSTAATLHLMASIANAGPFAEFVDVDEHRDLLGVMQSTVEFRDGMLLVPPGAGLGIEVDEAAVRRLAERA